MDYGLVAVFGCPAHDQRDLDFANKYELNVTSVISNEPNGDPIKITDKNDFVIDLGFTLPMVKKKDIENLI